MRYSIIFSIVVSRCFCITAVLCSLLLLCGGFVRASASEADPATASTAADADPITDPTPGQVAFMRLYDGRLPFPIPRAFWEAKGYSQSGYTFTLLSDADANDEESAAAPLSFDINPETPFDLEVLRPYFAGLKAACLTGDEGALKVRHQFQALLEMVHRSTVLYTLEASSPVNAVGFLRQIENWVAVLRRYATQVAENPSLLLLDTQPYISQWLQVVSTSTFVLQEGECLTKSQLDLLFQHLEPLKDLPTHVAACMALCADEHLPDWVPPLSAEDLARQVENSDGASPAFPMTPEEVQAEHQRAHQERILLPYQLLMGASTTLMDILQMLFEGPQKSPDAIIYPRIAPVSLSEDFTHQQAAFGLLHSLQGSAEETHLNPLLLRVESADEVFMRQHYGIYTALLEFYVSKGIWLLGHPHVQTKEELVLEAAEKQGRLRDKIILLRGSVLPAVESIKGWLEVVYGAKMGVREGLSVPENVGSEEETFFADGVSRLEGEIESLARSKSKWSATSEALQAALGRYAGELADVIGEEVPMDDP